MKRFLILLLLLSCVFLVFAKEHTDYRETSNKEKYIQSLFCVGFDTPHIPYIYDRTLANDFLTFSHLINHHLVFLQAGDFQLSEKTKVIAIVDGKLTQTKVTGATLLEGEASVLLDVQHQFSDKLAIGFSGTIPAQTPTIVLPEHQFQ